MKNFKLFLLLLISLSISMSSCKKTEEETTEDIINDILDIKGSIDLQVNGVTYDKLFSSVVYSTADKMVSFWAYDLDSEEDSFVLSFGEVPEAGATATINPEADDSITLMIIGSFNEEGGYYAKSGTITRVSTDKYEIDATIHSLINETETLTITGTVVVGEYN